MSVSQVGYVISFILWKASIMFLQTLQTTEGVSHQEWLAVVFSEKFRFWKHIWSVSQYDIKWSEDCMNYNYRK